MDPREHLPTLTLHGLAESIVALPYQMGYHPRDSLVLLCLGRPPLGPEGRSTSRAERVVLTARVDLPAPGEQAEVLQALEPALRRPETRAVIALVFAEPLAAAVGAGTVLPAVRVRAQRWGVEVRALASVSGASWRPVPCAGPPGPWMPLPRSCDVPAVAEYVGKGRAPAKDRAAVQALLRPTDPVLAAEVETLLRDGHGYGSPGEVGTVTPAQSGEAAAVLGRLVTGEVTAHSLGADELARCVSLLHDVPWRDTVLGRLTGAEVGAAPASDQVRATVHQHLPREPMADRMTAVRLALGAAYAPEPWAAPWLTVVALVAWHVGDGALANIAVDSARRCDPDYPLARLMDLTLAHAVPPMPRRRSGGGARCV